ncbi:MAG: D-amino-acid transaminase [Pseudomonadota bacterium]
MARVAYANGIYGPVSAPLIPVEDRGYQFSDGVYEVCLAIDGALWDAAGHFARWRRSLSELSITPPMSEPAMRAVIREVLRRNRLKSALVYMQATRGVASREHVFPAFASPSFVVTVKPFDLKAADKKAAAGIALRSTPDLRWARVDIKSIGLLPNVLAKDAARDAGAGEAVLHDDGLVSEGGSTNIWMLDAGGVLSTPPTDGRILSGITRRTVMDCATELDIKVAERSFTLDEAKAAKEMFVTSATSQVTPAVQLDETVIADGVPGPIALGLRRAYIDRCRREAVAP